MTDSAASAPDAFFLWPAVKRQASGPIHASATAEGAFSSQSAASLRPEPVRHVAGEFGPPGNHETAENCANRVDAAKLDANIAKDKDNLAEENLPDAELVARCLNGHRDAFGVLLARYENAVFRLAWRILRAREDAEDAAQEAFLRAWRSLGHFDPARGTFRAWLLKIALNAALTESARRREHAEEIQAGGSDAIEAIPDDPARSPQAQAIRKQWLIAIERLAAQLPPESAALFHLRYGENLPVAEIAKILDRAPGTVAVALHRLRKRLRQTVLWNSKD